MYRHLTSMLLFAALLLLALLAATTAVSAAAPHYDERGDLVVPADYREWVYLSTGLDMSYVEGAAADHPMFDNVFVDPAAWRSFNETGHWPDGTMLALEVRGATGRDSINRRGKFQSGAPMGVEFHVRDERRFAGGWAFFAGSETGVAKHVPEAAECYSCHRAHGAVDTTFVQFYPTARPIAEQAGSYRAE